MDSRGLGVWILGPISRALKSGSVWVYGFREGLGGFRDISQDRGMLFTARAVMIATGASTTCSDSGNKKDNESGCNNNRRSSNRSRMVTVYWFSSAHTRFARLPRFLP